MQLCTLYARLTPARRFLLRWHLSVLGTAASSGHKTAPAVRQEASRAIYLFPERRAHSQPLIVSLGCSRNADSLPMPGSRAAAARTPAALTGARRPLRRSGGERRHCRPAARPHPAMLGEAEDGSAEEWRPRRGTSCPAGGGPGGSARPCLRPSAAPSCHGGGRAPAARRGGGVESSPPQELSGRCRAGTPPSPESAALRCGGRWPRSAVGGCRREGRACGQGWAGPGRVGGRRPLSAAEGAGKASRGALVAAGLPVRGTGRFVPGKLGGVGRARPALAGSLSSFCSCHCTSAKVSVWPWVNAACVFFPSVSLRFPQTGSPELCETRRAICRRAYSQGASQGGTGT